MKPQFNNNKNLIIYFIIVLFTINIIVTNTRNTKKTNLNKNNNKNNNKYIKHHDTSYRTEVSALSEGIIPFSDYEITNLEEGEMVNIDPTRHFYLQNDLNFPSIKDKFQYDSNNKEVNTAPLEVPEVTNTINLDSPLARINIKLFISEIGNIQNNDNKDMKENTLVLVLYFNSKKIGFYTTSVNNNSKDSEDNNDENTSKIINKSHAYIEGTLYNIPKGEHSISLRVLTTYGEIYTKSPITQTVSGDYYESI